jgi:hypothetical protein
MNLTTEIVDNEAVGSGGNYHVPRSVPRSLGNPTFVVVVIVDVQSYARVTTVRIIPRLRIL